MEATMIAANNMSRFIALSFVYEIPPNPADGCFFSTKNAKRARRIADRWA
jgi:hypothetical protein